MSQRIPKISFVCMFPLIARMSDWFVGGHLEVHMPKCSALMPDVLSASASAMSGEFAKSTVVYPCRVSLVSIPEKIQANPTLWVSCPMMRVICRRPLVQSLVRVIFLCLNQVKVCSWSAFVYFPISTLWLELIFWLNLLQMRDFCSRRWEGYDLAIRARRSMGAPCIQYQRDGNRPSSKIRAWSFQNLHSSLQLCELTEISECSSTLRKQNNM